MLSKLELIGNVGADSVVNTVNDMTVINWNLCTTRKWKDKNGVAQSKQSWFNCSYWVKNTSVAQYITKGTLLYVIGEPEAQIYKNKDNVQVAQIKVNVSEIKLLSKPQQRDSTPETPQAPQETGDSIDNLPF